MGKAPEEAPIRIPGDTHFIRRVAVTFSVTLLAAGCGTAPLSTDAEPQMPPVVELALLPYQVRPQLLEIWAPMVDYLQSSAGVDVRLLLVDEYADYLPMVVEDEPLLVYLNPLQYLSLIKDVPYEPLVVPDQEMVGIIVTRVDSDVEELSDLAGRRISLLPESAMPGNIQPRAMLVEKAGLQAGVDYTVLTVDNHNLSVDAVLSGEADAGAVGTAAFNTLPDETRAQLRVLDRTPSQPPVVIVVRSNVDPELKQDLLAALMSLTGDDAESVLEPLGWTRLLPSDDSDFDPTRQLLDYLDITP